jgi:hypothetical protein
MANRALLLYRSLLRTHKKYLPAEMRELGNSYIKNEFKLHKTARPDETEQFFVEWEKYREQILVTARAQESRSSGLLDESSGKAGEGGAKVFDFGMDLPSGAELSSEQREQLKKLKEEAMKTGTSE